MRNRSTSPDHARRNFLKGVTLASVATIATPAAANIPLAGEMGKQRKAAAPGAKLAAAILDARGRSPRVRSSKPVHCQAETPGVAPPAYSQFAAIHFR